MLHQIELLKLILLHQLKIHSVLNKIYRTVVTLIFDIKQILKIFLSVVFLLFYLFLLFNLIFKRYLISAYFTKSPGYGNDPQSLGGEID